MERIKINQESSPQQGASPKSSNANPAVVSRAIQILFSAYRRDDFADPEGFVTQLGAILSDFPEEVVIYVTSPRTGMQRRSKWPPTISEIVTACEEHQGFLKRHRTEKPLVVQRLIHEPAEPTPGDLATLFVPKNHPRYPTFIEWTKYGSPRLWRYGKSSDCRDGIWINLTIWETPDRVLVPPGGR